MTQDSDKHKRTLSLNLSKIDPAKLQEKIQAAKENHDLNRPRKTLSLKASSIDAPKAEEKQGHQQSQGLDAFRKSSSPAHEKMAATEQQKRIQTNQSSYSPPSSSFKKPFPPRKDSYNPFKTIPLTKAQKKEIARKEREAAKKAKALKHEKETKKAIKEGAVKRFANMEKALTWLQTSYPDCFNFSHPKPLKIGITNDILKLLPQDIDFSKMNLRQAIEYYTHSPQYLRILGRDKDRYNLKGDKEGQVTSLQQEKSLEQIQQIHEYKEKARIEKQQKHQEWKKQQKPKKTFQGSYEQLQQNVRAILKISCEDMTKRHWLLSDYKEKTIEEMFFHQSRYQFNVPSLLQNECKGLLFFLDTFLDKGILESVDYKTFEGNKSFWMVKTKTDLYRVWIRMGYVGTCGSLSHQIEGFFRQNKDLFSKEEAKERYPFFDPSSYVEAIKTYPPQVLMSFMFVGYLNWFMKTRSEEVVAITQGKIDHLIQGIFKNNQSILPADIQNKESLILFCKGLYDKIKRVSEGFVGFKKILESITYKASEPHPCHEEAIPISVIYNDFYVAGLSNKKERLLPLIESSVKAISVPNKTFILNRFTSSWIQDDEVTLVS